MANEGQRGAIRLQLDALLDSLPLQSWPNSFKRGKRPLKVIHRMGTILVPRLNPRTDTSAATASCPATDT